MAGKEAGRPWPWWSTVLGGVYDACEDAGCMSRGCRVTVVRERAINGYRIRHGARPEASALITDAFLEQHALVNAYAEFAQRCHNYEDGTLNFGGEAS